MSSSKLRMFSSIALVILISALFTASALPIRQIKPVPNPILLALHERARFYANDYFAGFNLTFNHFVETEKLIAQEQTPFNSRSGVISAKSFKTKNGSIMAYLHKDLSVTVVSFDSENLFNSFKVSIAGATSCYDLEFLDGKTIVVDCNQDTTKTFSFISTSQKKVFKVTEQEEKYIKHKNRQLRSANNFNSTDLICLISSEDSKVQNAWQFSLIKFDDEYDIELVVKTDQTDLQNADLAFLLKDVLAVSSSELLLASDGNLFSVKLNGKKFDDLFSYPIDEIPISFSSLQRSGPLLSTLLISDSTAYEILDSQEAGYLEVADIFIDSIYKLDTRLTGNAAIECAQLTKDFVILVTGGSEPAIYIFERGNTKKTEIFYFNYISPQDFPSEEPVRLLADYDTNTLFWITDEAVQPFKIQEIWFEIHNDQAIGLTEFPLNISSENDYIVSPVDVNFLQDDEYGIFKLTKNEPLKFVKQFGESLEIDFEGLFAAPHINYYLQSSDNNNLAAPDYLEVPISIKDLPTLFASVDYDAAHDNIRLHHQSESSGPLDLYLCKFAEFGTSNPSINCDKKTSVIRIGDVQKLYAGDPTSDFVESIDENGNRVAYMASKKLSHAALVTPGNDGCDVIYKSYDNIIESNLFCAKGNNLSIVTNSTWVDIDHILLTDSFVVEKILTHPAFPGLLFISNKTGISIINSEFYLGPHYDAYTATINTIPVDDPNFNFVVTASHIVVFLPGNNSISEYDITNPLDIIFNKQYTLHGAHLVLDEKTIAYSPVTDFIYMIVTEPYGGEMYFLVVLEPDTLGHANLKYIFNTNKSSDPSEFILSVTSIDSRTDFVLHGASGSLGSLIVGKHPKVHVTADLVASADLFAQKDFQIVAKSPYTNDSASISASLYFINTQRNVIPREGDVDLKMELSFRNDTRIQFKEGDFFSGPAFRWNISNEVADDNIKLRYRVDTDEVLGNTALPVSISDIAYLRGRVTRGLIFLLDADTKAINVYNSTTFPDRSSKLPSPTIHGLGAKGDANECFQIEVDPNQFYMAALCYDDEKSAAYIDVMSVSESSLHYQLVTPTENPGAVYKIVSNYLFYTTRNSYNAIYIYKISTERANLKVDLLKIVTRDDLNIGRSDNITDLDGFKLGEYQAGVFVVTGSTGFNYISVKNDAIKISNYPNFLSLFSSDHLEGYNSLPVFHGLSLLRRFKVNDTMIYTLVLASKNAFCYKLRVQADTNGNLKDIQVLEGYIQYQNYKWVESVAATADSVILVASTPSEDPARIFLHYFFYDQKSIPTLNSSYPLYDAYQVISTETAFSFRQKPLLLPIKRKGESFIYLRNTLKVQGFTGGLIGYSMRDTFSLETPASRVSSSYVDLIAGNDFYNSSIRIPIQNYGNLLPGVNPGKIILFVFGGLGLAFIIAAVLIKVFSNKDKKQLKDTSFAGTVGETGGQSTESDASQYFKIED